jgi:DNA (cytosine-5)-methyltransferase 1
MRELALFAGAGGGILGGILLGWKTVCAVEIEDYPVAVLKARQRDGLLESFPIHRDIRTFDGKPWRGKADIVTGGFPCQDISAAKRNAQGINGEKSGLWSEMARVIGEVRPPFVFVENSPALVYRGLGKVLFDLSEMGFDAEWGVVGADACGAPHHRQRLWILAGNSSGKRFIPHEIQTGCVTQSNIWGRRELLAKKDACPVWKDSYTGVQQLDDGFPTWVDELRAVGNAQVPCVAATAFGILYRRLMKCR